MEDIKNVRMVPLPDSPYVKPLRLLYTQNGVEKDWDLLGVHDSVAIIIFNVTRRVLVLVKQFRPAMYFNSVHPDDREDNVIDTNKYPASLGIALEVCAGIVDKNKPILEIAREEVLEECGYDVPVDKMVQVISYRSGIGVQAALQTLFFCEVTDEMKTERGGGVDDELIEVVEKSVPEVREMLGSRGPLPSPPSFLFAMMWFLHYKADNYRRTFDHFCVKCKDLSDPAWLIQ